MLIFLIKCADRTGNENSNHFETMSVRVTLKYEFTLSHLAVFRLVCQVDITNSYKSGGESGGKNRSSLVVHS